MKIQLLISILFCQGYAAIEDSCGVPNEYDISLGRQCQGSIPHQFPWHVQLSACGNYCGGAIISNIFLKKSKVKYLILLLIIQLTNIF